MTHMSNVTVLQRIVLDFVREYKLTTYNLIFNVHREKSRR